MGQNSKTGGVSWGSCRGLGRTVRLPPTRAHARPSNYLLLVFLLQLESGGGVGGSWGQLEGPYGFLGRSEVVLLLFHRCLEGPRPQICIFLDSGGPEAGNLYSVVLCFREKGNDTCIFPADLKEAARAY